jgi:hypothetical protein
MSKYSQAVIAVSELAELVREKATSTDSDTRHDLFSTRKKLVSAISECSEDQKNRLSEYCLIQSRNQKSSIEAELYLHVYALLISALDLDEAKNNVVATPGIDHIFSALDESESRIQEGQQSSSMPSCSQSQLMKIRCRSCGHTEETSLGFLVKLIGGVMPLGGFWAWVTYFFAGTGFALPIVIAIISGGTAMLVFKDQIVQWILSKDYRCSKCGNVNWEAL